MNDVTIQLREHDSGGSGHQAYLSVFIKQLCATANVCTTPGERDFAADIAQEIIVDPYPLAEWFAANWWRLRWEAECSGLSYSQEQDWKMSHCLAAVGGGFIWPNITFTPDDRTVLCAAKPTGGRYSPIRFVQEIGEHVSAERFELAIDEFVSAVIARPAGNANLRVLWDEVTRERADEQLSLYRKLEAKAGFDADEAPPALIQTFHNLIERFGQQSTEELASAQMANPPEDIEQLLDRLTQSPHRMRPDLSECSTSTPYSTQATHEQPPWQRAAVAARRVRQALGVGSGPIKNSRICDFLAVPEELLVLTETDSLPSAGLHTDMGINVRLNALRETSRRFGLSRLLGDMLYTQEQESLLPATNAKTVRQKFQRAFAQELLCPYIGLMEWVDTESPDDELLENAAEHFQVSPLVAKYAYQNKAA